MRRNQPLGGNQMPRFAGLPTMMRLPFHESATGLDVAFVGVPMDIGTSHRSGTRFGPRQVRAESAMIRPYNMWSKVSPFDTLQIGDIGDIAIDTFDLKESVKIIEASYDNILAHSVIPIAIGGDHTLTYPILRAMHRRHGPLGLIHVDAHADINDLMFGEKIAHGTPFRRAHDEQLLDPKRVAQIGLRATGYEAADFDWPREQGWRVVQAEDIWYKSVAPLMQEIRAQMGDGPVYITFDIDSFDPAYAPGTGTLEPGGLTSHQGIELIRGCAGLNIVGCDLVEVSPPYDPSGATANLAANILFEMLCVLPGAAPRA